MTGRVPPSALRRVVELASLAPSVHNTQPWRWRLRDDALELRADRSRLLRVSDPDGRNLVISCGAALHHARVGAAALGLSVVERRFPDLGEPDLLARLSVVPAPSPPDAPQTVQAMRDRHTDRRRFTLWPVPQETLRHLAATARQEGVRAVPLLDVVTRFRAELLVERAADLQRADRALEDEQRAWVDHGSADGVPSAVLPMRGGSHAARPDRYGAGRLDDLGGRDVEGSDGLVVLADNADDAAGWLRAGAGLSALWLDATATALSVVPLTQVIEVPETRADLQLDVLGGSSRPLLLVRIGWQAIGRSHLPRTPRRAVDDILDGS